MVEKLHKLLEQMDEKHWVRISVCLVPGLLAGKVTSSVGAPEIVQQATSGLLLIGLIIYALWKPVRRRFSEEAFQGHEANEQNVQETTPEHSEIDKNDPDFAELMNELSGLCNGNAQEALRLVAMEYAVQDKSSYTDAIANALQRKKITLEMGKAEK